MNWLEKEVSNLELSKKLKELGFPQKGDGLFWIKWIEGDKPILYIRRQESFFTLYCRKIDLITNWVEIYRAYTCRELSLNLFWCNECLSFNVEKREIKNSEYAFYKCKKCGHNFRMKEVRFLVNPKTKCWIWQGAINKDGYGHYKQKGRIVDAHRGFYEAIIGEIPSGKQLHHKCKNTLCVNPYHLEILTVSKHCQKRKNCKLTLEDVKEINFLKGKISSRQIAKRFNISKTMVVEIWNDRKWKDRT